MIFKSNDKGELEKVNLPHVDTELLILSKLEQIEEELKSIDSKLGALGEKDNGNIT